MSRTRLTQANRKQFDVHEDHKTRFRGSGPNGRMTVSDVEDEEAYSSDSSERSEDSIGEVDESVAEDIYKLEETFKGISTRFRLINRIGEGGRCQMRGT